MEEATLRKASETTAWERRGHIATIPAPQRRRCNNSWNQLRAIPTTTNQAINSSFDLREGIGLDHKDRHFQLASLTTQ